MIHEQHNRRGWMETAVIFGARGHNLNHSYVIPSLDLVVARLGNDNRRSPDGTPFATTLIQKIVAAMGK